METSKYYGRVTRYMRNPTSRSCNVESWRSACCNTETGDVTPARSSISTSNELGHEMCTCSRNRKEEVDDEDTKDSARHRNSSIGTSYIEVRLNSSQKLTTDLEHIDYHQDIDRS